MSENRKLRRSKYKFSTVEYFSNRKIHYLIFRKRRLGLVSVSAVKKINGTGEAVTVTSIPYNIIIRIRSFWQTSRLRTPDYRLRTPSSASCLTETPVHNPLPFSLARLIHQLLSHHPNFRQQQYSITNAFYYRRARQCSRYVRS